MIKHVFSHHAEKNTAARDNTLPVYAFPTNPPCFLSCFELLGTAGMKNTSYDVCLVQQDLGYLIYWFGDIRCSEVVGWLGVRKKSHSQSQLETESGQVFRWWWVEQWQVTENKNSWILFNRPFKCQFLYSPATPDLWGQTTGYAGSGGFYVSSNSSSDFVGIKKRNNRVLALTVGQYVSAETLQRIKQRKAHWSSWRNPSFILLLQQISSLQLCRSSI